MSNGTDEPAPRISVVIADDHPLTLEGLRSAIDGMPGIEVVGAAENGTDALELIVATLPTVAVLDCVMPRMGGAQVAREVCRRGLPTRVLAISGYDDEEHVSEMLASGAVGYLFKQERIAVVETAIRAVARGEGYLSPRVAGLVSLLIQQARPEPVRLTHREQEVLDRVSEGLSNKEVAVRLQVTERTVVYHVSRVLQKLGVRSRWQAVELWGKRGAERDGTRRDP